MAAHREKDQGDFDLDQFVDMFDCAMTSDDPRVVDALRSLMMMVILTKPAPGQRPGIEDRSRGPLRRLFEDMNVLHRRIERIEEAQRAREYAEKSKFKDFTDHEWPRMDDVKMESIKMTAPPPLDKETIERITRQLRVQTPTIKK